MWIDTPETLEKIAKNKETGTNSFIMELYSYDRFPFLQEGVFYLNKWLSIEEVLIKWLCLEHDVVVMFSAKDNLRFPNVEMERKFKDLMSVGAEINFNAEDKYSRMSMEGIKLFELPKDAVESAHVVSKTLAQQKLKVAVVILRAEILLPRTGIDYRLLDNIKCWVTVPESHTIIFLTDNKENIHHEIRHVSPPLMGHIEWPAPTREDFERLFRNYKVIKPSIFNGNDLTQLAAACEGLQYLEIEVLLKNIGTERKVLTESILQNIASNARKQSAQVSAEHLFIGEKPAITFDNVVGLEDVKKIIRIKFIYPLQHSELYEKLGIKIGGGILLYGPPGTGKTMIAKAIAAELNAPFFHITASDIKDKWLGESENKFKRIFAMARRYKPCGILFIDEVEALLPKRGTQEGTHMGAVVGQFLAEMDGINTEKQTPVLVIGATNRPLDIDSAALRPGRFDYKILVPLPDKEMRRQIFYLNLTNPMTSDINYDLLADWTEGFSGADIAGICRQAKEVLVLKHIEGGTNHRIDMDIMQDVISKSRPSVSKSEMEKFKELKYLWNVL